MHARIHTCACIHKTNIHVCVGTHRHRYVCVYIYIYMYLYRIRKHGFRCLVASVWVHLFCQVLGTVLDSSNQNPYFRSPAQETTPNSPQSQNRGPHRILQAKPQDIARQSPSAVASVEIPHAPLAGCCEDFSADGFKVQVLAFDHDQRFGLRISWKLGMHGFVPKNC